MLPPPPPTRVAQLADFFVNELKICCHVIRKRTGSIINKWVRGYRTGLMCVAVSGYCCRVFSMGPKLDYADVVMVRLPTVRWFIRDLLHPQPLGVATGTT